MEGTELTEKVQVLLPVISFTFLKKKTEFGKFLITKR
jgi:hypothetical protein